MTLNRYIYGLSNPVNHTDPTGRCVDETCSGMNELYLGYRGKPFLTPPTGPSSTGMPNDEQTLFIQFLYDIWEDGYGARTKASVRGLQEKKGIPVDSQVMIGPLTWVYLLERYADWVAAYDAHGTSHPLRPSGLARPVASAPVTILETLGIEKYADRQVCGAGGCGPLTGQQREAYVKRYSEKPCYGSEEQQLECASGLLGIMPYLGDAKDFQETVTGVDLVTGKTLTPEQRALTGVAFLLPVVGGKTLRSLAPDASGLAAKQVGSVADGQAAAKVVNKHLAGTQHKSGIWFDLDGFPVFNSKFDARLPAGMYTATDAAHFRTANEQLLKAIEKEPVLASQFTKEQLSDISSLNTPRGYTWHHHQEAGRMQLVDAKLHLQTGHTGGRSLWGGGTKYR